MPRDTRRRTAKSREPPARLTINDIARLAAVSKKTVSRVINRSPFVKEETRAHIKSIIDAHGYHPDPQARGLAFRRSFLIGMIYEQPNPQYVVSMQEGILDALSGSGFELVIRPCQRQSKTFFEDIRTFVERQKLYGVVLPPPLSEAERLARLLDELGCRYVRIASVSLDDPERMVVTHDHLGGAAAARRLAELGHRCVAHVSGPPSFRSSHERRRGFVSGLAEFGLTLPKTRALEGAYTYESGLECGRSLLAKGQRPTAIFTGNDEMAFGIYRAAQEAGLRIPHDLSVVGFDDLPIASRIWPPLSSVRLPIHDMGKIAAEKLLAASEARHRAGIDEFKPTLIERASIAAPRTERA